MIRSVAELTVGAMFALNVVIESAAEVAAQAVVGPDAVVGGDTLWDVAMLLAGAVLIWRAATYFKGMQSSQDHMNEKFATRVERLEGKWQRWEPLLIEWEIRNRWPGKESAG